MDFYLEPPEVDARALTAGIASIQLTRVSGETLSLDPAARVEINQEHPSVERMEGDLGAICEVFRQSSNYYLKIEGVSLAPGDQVKLSYAHGRYTVALRVVELENGRTRIDPPVVGREGG